MELGRIRYCMQGGREGGVGREERGEEGEGIGYHNRGSQVYGSVQR